MQLAGRLRCAPACCGAVHAALLASPMHTACRIPRAHRLLLLAEVDVLKQLLRVGTGRRKGCRKQGPAPLAAASTSCCRAPLKRKRSKQHAAGVAAAAARAAAARTCSRMMLAPALAASRTIFSALACERGRIYAP